MDFSRLCIGCMKEKKTAEGRCPHCGFDLSAYQPNPRCLPPNTILAGKYLVGRVLGQGGFGITYMGFDLNMETRVAIKEYFPVELVSRDTTSMTGDRVLSLSGEKSRTYQQGLEKYVKEAQNVSQFSDVPGVVSVKDFFYENETAYIVMEYIEGESLKDYLSERGGRLPEAEALAILRPVLDALKKVHAAGIIHRDISPDNIMLTFEGGGTSRRIASVKLIDFGAARMTAKNDQKSLTIILKHGYAPEEQYRTHGEQGPWTDVYAISAVLYRMLTGETPVPAMDRMFQDSLKGFDAFPAKVSKGTADAVQKGLSVKKEDRIQSVAELTGALYEGKTVRKHGGRKNGKTAAVIGVAAACVLLAAGLFFAFNGKQDGQETIQTGQEMETQAEEKADSVDSTQEVTFSEETGSEVGETIVERTPQTSVSVRQDAHTLFLMQDGTVQARGSNNYGQCMVQDWDHIAAVSTSDSHSLGLRTDGTVLAAGLDTYGQCSGVDTWSDIIAVAAGGSGYTSYGLKAGGTILSAGLNLDGYMEEIAQWTDITAICSPNGNNGLIGLDSEGGLHYAGLNFEALPVSGWDDVVWITDSYSGHVIIGLCGDGNIKMEPLISDFSSFEDVAGMRNWTTIDQVSIVGVAALGVRSDGTVEYLDSCDEGLKAELAGWTDMEAVAVTNIFDRVHVLGLQKDGNILEYYGNCGNSSPEEMENLAWIQVMDCSSADNLVAKTIDGQILTWGLEPFRLTDLPGRMGVAAQDIAGIVGIDAVLMMDKSLIADVEWFLGEAGEDVLIGENAEQALELWDAAYSGVGTCGYALLKTDGSVEIKTLGAPLEGTGVGPENWLLQVSEAENWTDIVQMVGQYDTLYGLRSDGTVLSIGGETIEAEGVTRLAWRGSLLVGIMEDQTVQVLASGQYDEIYGRTQLYNWAGIVDVAVGESHVVGLREDGTVVAAGSNHTGQCEVEDWTDIVYLTAGRNCTLGITSDGELKMAGSMY